MHKVVTDSGYCCLHCCWPLAYRAPLQGAVRWTTPGGADGLAEATTFVGTVMIYVVEILYAVAGIMVVISALQIYIKMNYHEHDITKSVMILFGGILFMIGASVVMPALFGYQDMNFIF